MFRTATLAVFSILSTTAESAELTSSSTIDSVVVFPDQAQVTRVATVNVVQGDHTLILSDLPLQIDPDTVRVEALSDAAVQIGSVDLRDITPPPIVPQLSTEAEQKIRALTAERGRLDDVISASETKRRLIERLGSASTDGFVKGIGEGNTTATSITEAWNAFGDGVAAALKTVRDSRIRQAEIDDEIQRIRATMDRDPQVVRSHGEARVALSVSGQGSATFRLTYRMERAGWQPVYDARLSTGNPGDKPSIALVTRAFVQQATGEDWKNVDLTLSTARPSRGTSAPALRPLLVQFWQPEYGLAKPRAAPSVAKALSRNAPVADEDSVRRSATEAAPAPEPAAPPPKQAVEQQAQLDTGGITAVFHIPGRVGVDTGVGGRSVKVSETSVEPQLSVKAVPKQVAVAYLTAAFRPKGDAALLPGKVSIYRNGQFVGLGQIPFVAAGDDIKLGFGEDDRVKVERVALKQIEGDTGTFTTTHVETHDYKIKIKNLHDRPIPVTIEDQIPVSEATDLVVEKLSTTTPPTKTNVDDRRGILAWSFDMKPNEDKEIRIGWRVKYPAERPIGWRDADR